MTTNCIPFFALYMCAYRHSDSQVYICVHRHKTNTYRPKLHTWNVFNALPPCHNAIFGSVQYTTAAAHRSLLEFELMSSTPPHMGLSLPLTDFNVGADFGDLGGDFSASFGFDTDFGAVFGNFADFFGGSVTSDFEVDSCGSSSDNRSGHCRQQRRWRRHRRPNLLFRVESVKNSSWYRNFTAPGVTRDLTHELSSSDRFGEFRHYFRMPLSKVEALTDTLITCGYVWFPQSRCRQAKFRERTELLVVSSLYLLGTGAAFCSC